MNERTDGEYSLFPCESAVWKALPALRSALAKALVERKISQRKIAELFDTTEASISHYVKGKRGSSLILGPHVQNAIGHIADKIVDETINTEKLAEELCGLCQRVRRTCAMCDATSPDNCEECRYVLETT